MLFPCLVLPLIHGSICPGFFTLAVLEIVFPLTLIACTIHMNISSETIRFVVDPVALVDVSVDMNELSMPVGPVVFPLTLIASTIRPHLHSVPVTEPTYPLALICRTSFESVEGSLFSFTGWIVFLI